MSTERKWTFCKIASDVAHLPPAWCPLCACACATYGRRLWVCAVLNAKSLFESSAIYGAPRIKPAYQWSKLIFQQQGSALTVWRFNIYLLEFSWKLYCRPTEALGGKSPVINNSGINNELSKCISEDVNVSWRRPAPMCQFKENQNLF